MIIAFRGEIGAGKSTAAKYLQSRYRFSVVSFATPLKWAAEKITPDGKIDKVRDRKLLQFLGTDYYRGIDENYWVKKYASTLESRLPFRIRVATDDARFDNEFDFIKAQRNGYLVWIHTNPLQLPGRLQARDGAIADGIKGHASEGSNNADDPRNDFHISNLGSEIEFQDSLDTLIERLIPQPTLCRNEDCRNGSIRSGQGEVESCPVCGGHPNDSLYGLRKK